MAHLPESLIDSLFGGPGFNEAAFRAVHEGDKRTTSIRYNSHKISGNGVHDSERNANFSTKVLWAENGYYLSARPSFVLDPLWHAGAYYVQDASSMSLGFVLKSAYDLGQPLRILDLCAAPGGKSTLLADIMSPDSLLVSNEVIASRKHIVVENLIKWGNPNIIITQNDARDFGELTGFFDVIIVDAPCSGSGLFRKDPQAISEWSTEQVALCSKRQKRIVSDVMPALKDNGLLVYSTCSYSAEENEQIGDYLLEKFPLKSMAVPFKKEWNIVETQSLERGAKGYRFYPDKLEGEGFYISCFKKNESSPVSPEKKALGKLPFPLLKKNQRNIGAPWVRHAERYEFFLLKDQIMSLSSIILSDWQFICQKLHVVYAGVLCGKMIRDNLIPRHELAVNDICSGDVDCTEVDIENAIRYLRKEDMVLQRLPRGWSLINYQGCHLGWIKGISGRVNNYYPVNWRIKKPADHP